MYSFDWSKIFPRRPATEPAPAGSPEGRHRPEGGPPPVTRGWPGVSRTVWALGFTSLLTDISSEMVASILPVYLVLYLGISPLAFGVVDGLYRGIAAVVRVAGGVLADRWQRHKTVAILGYGLSAACRLLIFMAGNAWGIISAIVTLDRIGKGLRTAPRDALISKRSPMATLATAFGVHRALDAVGALLGPVFAFVLLTLMPHAFNVVFVASFGVAILGLGIITLFVPAVEPDDQPVAATPVSLKTALQLLGEARFRALVLAAIALGLASISDGFIFLILQRRLGVGVATFPLLYVGASLITAMFAVPCGRLADRLGRRGVLLGGYGLLALVYAVLLLPGGGYGQMSAVLVLLGGYYAATDGVLTAMAAAVLPQPHAGSGLAVIATAADLARLAASVVFGLVWSLAGSTTATTVFLLALAAAMVVAAGFLIRPKAYAT